MQTSHILGEKNQCQHPRTAKPSNPDKLKVAHSMVHSKPNFQKQKKQLVPLEESLKYYQQFHQQKLWWPESKSWYYIVLHEKSKTWQPELPRPVKAVNRERAIIKPKAEFYFNRPALQGSGGKSSAIVVKLNEQNGNKPEKWEEIKDCNKVAMNKKTTFR